MYTLRTINRADMRNIRPTFSACIVARLYKLSRAASVGCKREIEMYYFEGFRETLIKLSPFHNRSS